MFFDKLSEIPEIAARTSCSVFVVPSPGSLKISPKVKKSTASSLAFPNSFILEPDSSKKTVVITIEQVRDFMALSMNKQTTEQFYIINPADAMNEAAQNAFLKTLEEPHHHCHFVLFTENPSRLLPTILSRAQIYRLRQLDMTSAPISANAKVLDLAKKLVSANSLVLPSLAAEIAAKKPQPRQIALDATAAAIEMLYKSYFKTKNQKFLAKIPDFINLHDALSRNGHIKLQIVANLS